MTGAIYKSTTVRIAREIIENLVFGYAQLPVRIEAISPCEDGYPGFDITIIGEGLPDAPRVTALCTVEQNRAGQKLVRMTFQPST